MQSKYVWTAGGTSIETAIRSPAGLAVWCGYNMVQLCRANHPDIFIITSTGSRFWSSDSQTNIKIYGMKTLADGLKAPR